METRKREFVGEQLDLEEPFLMPVPSKHEPFVSCILRMFEEWMNNCRFFQKKRSSTSAHTSKSITWKICLYEMPPEKFMSWVLIDRYFSVSRRIEFKTGIRLKRILLGWNIIIHFTAFSFDVQWYKWLWIFMKSGQVDTYMTSHRPLIRANLMQC